MGEIPKEITGTFYRVMCDPFVPPHPDNVPLDGDGSIQAFRVKDGRVDVKMRYIETERYKLERKANKALFGLYRNPFTHHPCVRAAVDSTANTNLVYWADHLLALEEGALPYAVDPHTLETRGYDPFEKQNVESKTFTAHPKVDPYTEELVVFGYEAKGVASKDIVVYHLDKNGNKYDEQWIEAPWPALIHDSAITTNFLILVLWPFEASVERMKQGKQHWAWDYKLPATFIVVPRRKTSAQAAGWQEDEHRVYPWRNCMPIHTAGAWEEDDGHGSKNVFVESSRVHDNALPFFPPDDGTMPAADAKADFVRWSLDLCKPSGTLLPDPRVVLDLPSEFPRIDERLMTTAYNTVFLCVFLPDAADGSKNIFHGLNALAMHDHGSNTTRFFYAGDDALVQEPVFVPRTTDASEADGWVLAMVERRAANRNDLIVVDTRQFERPVAIVQLPFHVKSQIHGNWVEAERLGTMQSIVREAGDVTISKKGALEPFA
ncbi:carotenoid oxygenase [Phyllosticta citrichinensis]|uniref:Carotenoid oxygenase n=1 Tax=Phyllosticta citrichinensis TaxID=1130410 RepID=A0ABR1XKN0_9PEZI